MLHPTEKLIWAWRKLRCSWSNTRTWYFLLTTSSPSVQGHFPFLRQLPFSPKPWSFSRHDYHEASMLHPIFNCRLLSFFANVKQHPLCRPSLWTFPDAIAVPRKKTPRSMIAAIPRAARARELFDHWWSSQYRDVFDHFHPSSSRQLQTSRREVCWKPGSWCITMVPFR